MFYLLLSKTDIKNFIYNYKKVMKKDREYFTIDPELNKIFEKFLNDNLLDKSKVIENLVKEYVIKNGLIKKEENNE